MEKWPIILEHYKLPKNPKILDIGWKDIYFLSVIISDENHGIDISKYAIETARLK